MFPWIKTGRQSIPMSSSAGSPQWPPVPRAARRVGLGACALLLLLLLAAANLASAGTAGNDYERMEQFLARLGLFDLRIVHLEQTLDEPLDQQRKQKLARDLADLYAERLVASSDNKARYDDTMQRIDTLLAQFPQANTTALQVMLLQADYYRAESLIAAWISQPGKTASRDEARNILKKITPRLVEHQQTLNERVKTLLAKTDELPQGDELQAREEELQRIEAVAARAMFFAAWSNYYLGLAAEDQSGGGPYAAARDIFFRLLGFDGELPEDLEAEWLGLDSIWRARALIGLGLSLAASGEVDGCARCFEALEHPSVPTEVRDQAPSWYVRALLDAEQWERAETYARQQINAYHPPATQGKVSLCVALARAGLQGASGRSAAPRKLGELGLVGLARLGRLGAINTLIDKYQIKRGEDAGFVLLWAAGQKKFAAAEKSRAASGYEAAAKMLRKALQSPETKALAGPAARCRYTLAWCYFRLEKFEQAGKEFSDAFPGLHESHDELAVESAWMAFVAYRKLAESNARFVTRASDARKRLRRNFPDHSHVERADYEMTKLLEERDPATLMEQLKAISTSDPNYALARYDLCMALYRQWQREHGKNGAGDEHLEAIREAVDTYLQTVNSADTDPRQRVRVCLRAADAALHHHTPDLEMAQTMLQSAGRWASELPDSRSEVLEYHYRRLELASAQGDQQGRREQADWLADHAKGSPYEQAALVIVANALDKEISTAAASERETLNERAYTVYQRLVGLFDKQRKSRTVSKNARIATSRLAHYALRIGRPAESARLLDRLLDQWPRNRNYLQRAAKAHLKAGQYAQALPYLRTLLSGLPGGTEDWYEAKYQQLMALAQTDKTQARKVYRQFKLLYPDLGGEAWRGKFTSLAQRW